jgi:DNA-3-methyladenine glycosylase II
MAADTFRPTGPYDLAHQNEYFGGWPTLGGDGGTIVIALPVDGWQASAAVLVSQRTDGRLELEVFGGAGSERKATEQALAALSLDVDGAAWPEVGERDEHIGGLLNKYNFLRPVLFNSPYEAAANFIIGHRISMKQGRAIRARMAEAHGTKIDVRGEVFAAFPEPERLLAVSEFRGLNSAKIGRLHGVAEAALAGTLDRAKLRQLPIEEAARQIRQIDGIGPFFASGILNRGAGVVDDITDDDLTKYAVQVGYELPERPTQAEVLTIAEKWKPYRMWAEVLLHVWLRREVGLPSRRR